MCQKGKVSGGAALFLQLENCVDERGNGLRKQRVKVKLEMNEQQRFKDRREAGRVLAEQLKRRGYGDRNDVIVLALPRGGVPVGYEVARELRAALDVFIVRKV